MPKVNYLLNEIKSINEIGAQKFLILDGGEQVNIAERLGRDAEVFYFVPWYDSDPKVDRPYVGLNLKGVTVVYDYWNHLKEADRIFFPDCYYEDLAENISEQGYIVIGPRKAAVLEYDKEIMRKECMRVGLKMAEAEKIKGLKHLIRVLDGKEGTIVKPKIFRGESETWEYKSKLSGQAKFDGISLSLGPFAESFEWFVEKPVKGLEMGVDGITIDGELIYPMIWGCTSGYMFLGRIDNPDKVPEPFKSTNSKLSKLFEEYKVKSFFGTEEIIHEDKKGSTFIDLAMRLSNSHISGIFTELIKNFPDFLFSMGSDKIIIPDVEATHVGSAVLVLSKEAEEWVTIKSPKEMTNLKLEYMSKNQEGDYIIAPRKQVTCGALVALGKSWDEVISKLQEDFKKIEASIGLDPIPGVSEYEEMIEKVNSFGLEF
jgi:hypothetical protein